MFTNDTKINKIINYKLLILKYTARISLALFTGISSIHVCDRIMSISSSVCEVADPAYIMIRKEKKKRFTLHLEQPRHSAVIDIFFRNVFATIVITFTFRRRLSRVSRSIILLQTIKNVIYRVFRAKMHARKCLTSNYVKSRDRRFIARQRHFISPMRRKVRAV